VTYLIPFFATLIGVIGLGEHLTWYQPVGALVVLAGVAVSQGTPAVAKRWMARRAVTSAPEPDRTGEAPLPVP
jgi:threonine/homoserine efflux transporter RhtA